MYVEVSAVHALGSTGSLGEFPPCEMQGLERYQFFSKMGFFLFLKSGYYCVALSEFPDMPLPQPLVCWD